jgi:hypothetical protein
MIKLFFILGSMQIAECFGNLVQGPWDVKAAFPLSSFSSAEYLSTPVQITKPLSIFRITEFLPGICMHGIKPF